MAVDIETLVQLTESLRGWSLRRYSGSEIREKLRVLFDGYSALCIERSEHHVWVRARPCEADVYDSLKQCIYPPRDRVGYGRANLPGAPAMYGAWNLNTSLDEISVESGHVVQVIFYAVRPGMAVSCNVVGDYAHVLNSGRSQINSSKIVEDVKKDLRHVPAAEHQKHVFVDTFLAEQYSRPHGRPFEFKLTAALASILYERRIGIIYPSVERRGGMNLATSVEMFDRDFHVVSTTVLRIKSVYGCGQYEMQLVKGSSTFALDGTIDWLAPPRFDLSHSLTGGLSVPEGYTGWQVPNRP